VVVRRPSGHRTAGGHRRIRGGSGFPRPAGVHPCCCTGASVRRRQPGVVALAGFEGIAISPDEKLLYVVLQSPLLNPDRKTGELSRNTRLLTFDIAGEKVIAEYVYRFDISKEFDPNPKNTPDEMKLSGVAAINPTTLLVLERTDLVAKLYSVDLTAATNILNSKWDDPKTTPTLEALEDPGNADVRVLPKSLIIDLSRMTGVPEKIEGVAILNANTIAVSNDNDFDSEESRYDDQGNNVGKGKKSQIVTISLEKPLPFTAK
jgi:hypothetical protein